MSLYSISPVQYNQWPIKNTFDVSTSGSSEPKEAAADRQILAVYGQSARKEKAVEKNLTSFDPAVEDLPSSSGSCGSHI